jgi:TatD DNase family protein
MIDTHAHIYLTEFDNDRNVIIQKAVDEGVELIIMPAIDSSTHHRMLAVEQQFAFCRSMIGVHPCSVNGKIETELESAADLLCSHRFVAIGEIGLDFYWDRTHEAQQYIAFRRQMELAVENDLPVVIHSRSAIEECIRVVSEYPGARGVFHCFSGTLQQAQLIVEQGLLLGIGGVVTFKNAGLDRVIENLGIQHTVLETDAPYLAPVPFRGKRNEPAYLKHIAAKISEVSGCSIAEVTRVTTENAVNLFKL